MGAKINPLAERYAKDLEKRDVGDLLLLFYGMEYGDLRSFAGFEK